MSEHRQDYDIRLDDKYGPLALIDVGREYFSGMPTYAYRFPAEPFRRKSSDVIHDFEIGVCVDHLNGGREDRT